MKELASLLLPAERETRLLRAVLSGDGDAVDAVRRGGPPRPRWPPLSLVPLLADALTRRGSRQDDPVLPWIIGIRTVDVRMRHRSRTVRRLLRAALDALADAGVGAIVLRGAALAETVYPKPELRHCHDLDLWISPADAARAGRALEAVEFRRVPSSRGADGPRFLHPNGLPLHLHRRAFRLSFHDPPAGLFPGPPETIDIGGRAARVPAPAPQLLHVLGHAASGPGRDTLRWACDAWFLLRARPDLDPARWVELAVGSRLALPLSVQLPYLRDGLGAPVPDALIEPLVEAAARSGHRELEALIHGVRCGRRGTARAVLEAARGARWRTARWIALPTPTAVRWRRPGLGPAGLAVHYLTRPLRGIAGAARRAHSERGSPLAAWEGAHDDRDAAAAHTATTA